MTKRQNNKPRDQCSLLLKDISKRLREQFKAYCARRGMTMRETLLIYMKNCVISDSSVLAPLPTPPEESRQ